MVRVLGGKWLVEHRGKGADAIQGKARGELAPGFCERWGLAMSFRVDLKFGVHTAGSLCRAWCHKAQHGLLILELFAGVPRGRAFSASDLAAYVEPPDVAIVLVDTPKELLARTKVLRAYGLP